jgi:hypothetical protein
MMLKLRLSIAVTCIHCALLLSDAKAEPITGLEVVTGKPPIEAPPGFKKLDADLNKGAKGKYIYLCYKRGGGRPITDLAVIVDGSSKVAAPAGYTKISKDLNEGAHGKYIYLCYRTDGAHPINDITVIEGKGVKAQLPYQKIDVDLNTGCGADTPNLYFAYRENDVVDLGTATRGALAGIAREYVAEELDGKNFENETSDHYKKALVSVTAESKISVRARRPKTDLSLTFPAMFYRRNDQLHFDISVVYPVSGSVRCKIPNVVSVSSNVNAVMRLGARVRLDVKVSGDRIKANVVVESVSGKIENLEFSNDVVDSARGYIRNAANDAINDHKQKYMDHINAGLKKMAVDKRFSEEIRKVASR